MTGSRAVVLPMVDTSVLAGTVQALQRAAALGSRPDGDVTVGTVMFLESGWDCVRVEFFVVVRRTRRTVVLRPLASRFFPEQRPFPEDSFVLPLPEVLADAADVRAWLVPDEDAGDDRLMVKAGGKYGWVWDGFPARVSADGSGVPR
jgi:hypothetical protein